MSDYIHLSCIHPLQPGDENYAIASPCRLNAPGVQALSAPAFALRRDNSFDYPLTSRFDETDCFVVLDNVFVPWEHVFIYRNLEVWRDQWWKTPSHLYGNHQAQARYVDQAALPARSCQAHERDDRQRRAPPVQVEMGELAAYASIVESMLLAQETLAPIEDGVLWPSKTALYSSWRCSPRLNPA